MSSCAIEYEDTNNSIVKDEQCVDSFGLSPEEADTLVGSDMRQDLNQDPLFRAATVNIASYNGYGSGALVRKDTGELAVRTVRHVLEPATASPYGGIFFPGYGWWSVAGCDLEETSVDKVGDSLILGDSVSEILIPDDVSSQLDARIAEGKIQPLANYEDAEADYFIEQGYVARIADAKTGSYTEIPFLSDDYTDNDNIINLYSSRSDTIDVICQGRSGQPVQMGDADTDTISDETFGSVSMIRSRVEDIVGDDPRCSSAVVAIKNR